MRTLTFDETLATKLYYELKNDHEIGLAVGKNSNTISNWRMRRDLPCIAIDPRTGDEFQENIDFRNVLTPWQTQEMDRFLRALSFAGRKAVQAGAKPDVGHFIKVWSHRFKTEEERQQEENWREKERRAVRSAG